MYRTILCAAAALFIASQAEAQAQQQLIGSWLLTSFEFTDRNGALHQFPTMKGIFIFDANGRYAEIVGRADRPKFKDAVATTEELAANTRDFFGAKTGTWSVNDKTLRLRLELSLRPQQSGNGYQVFHKPCGGRTEAYRRDARRFWR